MNEGELMTIEDYDAIIDKGFNAWAQDYYLNRLDNLMDKLGEELAYAPKAMDKFVEAGIVSFSPFTTTTPYEMFCGGRTMVKFTKDLFKYADKVQAAMDVAMPDILANIKQFAAAPSVQKPIAAWVGGWRGASEFLSPKMWNRFIWPYYKKIVEEVVAVGIIPVLHLDSNWERDIEYFRELPKGKCVFSPDGSTNIFKVKAVLGDHMCIMGDVPAALLTLGNPDEVYKYATKLINEIGPAGLIMASGCDIPANAKPENVAAMISSCAYR
jgi:uroporphyrinogen-III decarboxylase